MVGLDQVYTQWQKASDNEEASWAANEINTATKNIEWDLQDLEQSIEMVKNDSKRFSSISQHELDSRNQFITDTRTHIQTLQKTVSTTEKNKSARNTRNVGMTFGLLGYLFLAYLSTWYSNLDLIEVEMIHMLH